MNKVALELCGHVLIVISDSFSYIFLLIKIYRVLCFTKLTFDQLPTFNPYKWPLACIRVLTVPYFRFWSKVVPSLKLGRMSYDISALVALEMIGVILFLCSGFRVYTFGLAEKIFAGSK